MENEQIKSEIQNLLERAKAKFVELDQEYAKFSSLREDLKNKAGGIRNFHSSAQAKEGEIKKIFDSVTQTTQVFSEKKSQIEKIYSDISSYHEKFSQLREKLSNQSNGLEASFEWITGKREEATKKYEEIIKIKDDSEGLKKLIQEAQNQVDGFRIKSETLKKEIEKWLDLVQDSAKFNEFSKRKKQLRWESYMWLGITVLAFGGLAFFVYEIFVKTPGVDFTTSLNKFFYTTPIIFLLIWSTKNYSESRLYLEKYAYRAIMSVSLSSYLELLESKFGEDNEKL